MGHMDNLIGKQIANYKVIAEIAQRDTIQVYQGRHSIFTDRMVVLKVFDIPHLSSQQHQRFTEATRQLEKLKHPQILPLIDAGIYEGKPYLVTIYAPNGSLRTYLSHMNKQPVPHQEALQLLSQIGQALYAAHQQQILHGNLKPENILFDIDHNACLTDFCLLAFSSSPFVHRAEPFHRLTYIAPEQLQRETMPQSDQYALSCIAYELLTGSPPLLVNDSATSNLPSGRTAILSSTHRQVHLPIHIEEAIFKALEKEPERRHVSVFAFLAAIGAVTQLPQVPTTICTASNMPLSAPSPRPSTFSTPLPMTDRPEVVHPPSPTKEATTLSLHPRGQPRTIAREKMTAEQLIREGATYLETWRYQEALASYEQAIERGSKAAEAYSGKGDVLRELDCQDEALAAYEEALRLDPQCPAALVGKGYIFCTQERYEAALAAFEQAIQSNATYYEAYTGKRSALSNLGRDEEARATSRALLALCQRKQASLPAAAYYAQGLTLLHLHRRDEALRTFEQCIYHYPSYLDAYEHLALLYYAREDYENELAVCERAILINPECARFHRRKASALVHLERYLEVLDACNRALQLDPEAYLTYHDKGEALLHLNRNEEALQALNRAIELSPNFVVAYTDKAEVLANLHRNEEALAAYDHAIQLQSDDWFYYWQKAKLLTSLARYEDAIATYDQFIELRPHENEGYLWKLFFLKDYELYEEGLVTCERWLTANPHYAQVYWWKGRMLMFLDRKEEALPALEEAIRLNPKDREVYLSKARTLGSLKRYEEALQTYDQAIQVASKKEKVETYQEKAKLLGWLKRYEEELAVYQHIVRLTPKDASAHYHTGEILCHLERKEEALEAYNRAILLNAKFTKAYTAKGELLHRFERYEEALEMGEKALQLDRDNVSAYFLQEKVLRALGKEKEAEAVHEQGFSLFLSAIRLHIEEANAQYERKQRKRSIAQ